ncbi:MAG: thiamine pyrophosphate-dependent dehydrogenase E1 component subunit alpha [Acidobacteriota bacterium]
MSEGIVRILRADGSLEKGCSVPAVSLEEQVQLYGTMLLNRRIDERMIKLQRQGRLGFYIGSIGEEAAVVGSAFVLRKSDWIIPCYRELGAALWRGFPLYDLFCQLFSNAEDGVKGRQMPNHYAASDLRFGSISSPVGTQIPQAVGLAWAAKISGSEDVVLVYFGEGATSEGDFHVGANFGSVFEAPVVLFCRNNQWAISVPISRQTASESIAIKAQAYGMKGVRVDGNDVLGVISVAREAVDRARAGGGPTLVEAETYRLSAHSTSDDPRVYRDPSDVEVWKGRDPLRRFKAYLIKQGHWSEEREKELEEEIRDEIQDNLQKAEAIGPPPVETMFEDVFDKIPWHLREQLGELQEAEEPRKVEQKA